LNYFRRFSQAEIERFWRPLWRWLIGRLPGLAGGYSLDLDSTIFARHGTQQQGAARGYNPRRPGRLSHHPLLAVLAEANFVLHAWLRSGNSGSGQGAAQFLSEALSLLGSAYRVRCVRADSGFYADIFLSFLEQRALPYIVVARLTSLSQEPALSDHSVASRGCHLFGERVPLQTLELERSAALCGGAGSGPTQKAGRGSQAH